MECGDSSLLCLCAERISPDTRSAPDQKAAMNRRTPKRSAPKLMRPRYLLNRSRKAGNQEKSGANDPFLPSCLPDLSAG
jgi:hypothetical protein